ncbi:MAG: amidohydrolase family protein [Fidelibacterota bacterium]|nr:MAG: amidohydrolase family protein [Candidatus Neomarinimicrobiota bacterium]
MKTRRLLTVVILACSIAFLSGSDQVPAPKQERPIVLTGGTIHPVSGPSIPKGQILFTDGRIVEVGARVSIPENADVIDVSGKHIYPGFIAAQSIIGLVEVGAVRATLDQEEAGSINPNVHAERAYNPDSEHMPVARANGVVLAQVVPQGGLLSGTSAVMMLDGWTWEDALLRSEVGIWVNWPDMVVEEFPWITKSRKEQEKEIQEKLKQLDKAFDEAEAYHLSQRTGSAELKTDLRWESLKPVLEGKVPLFIQADHVSQITAAVNWAARRGYRMVLVGGRDSWMVTEVLKENQIPVVAGDVHSLPERRWAGYDARFSLPEKLRSAGVEFCLSPSNWYSNIRNLPFEAGTAVAFGLPREEAVKAITLYPARILGIDHRVGSLDPGKDATLLVTEGDPLDIRSQVEQVYIQGRKVDLGNRHKSLYQKYSERHRQLGISP